ncbi:hypothetical protein [Roseateles sp.]|uniref:hypothetical protein n=1 Tax=Roseateles sp. TaxID=1971397 RepID=UPI0031E0F643
MNPRSKITTVAMAIALASGVGFLHAQSGGQGGSSGSVGARDQTNDPLSNNNNQNNPPRTNSSTSATPAANPGTGQPAGTQGTQDMQNTQPATSSQYNGNNTTTEQRQDPNVRTPVAPMPQDNSSSMNNGTPSDSSMNSDNANRDSTLPARADRN